jgi:hypothetical protein
VSPPWPPPPPPPWRPRPQRLWPWRQLTRGRRPRPPAPPWPKSTASFTRLKK